MRKEEKEAIKTLKNIVLQEYDWWINKGDYAESNVKEANDAIKTILNLIKKQQKEIEELEAKNKQYQGIEDGTTIIYKSKAKYVREDKIKRYYVDKNEIREKIKELEQFQEQHKEGTWGDIPIEDYDFDKINLLKELLGEEE